MIKCKAIVWVYSENVSSVSDVVAIIDMEAFTVNKNVLLQGVGFTNSLGCCSLIFLFLILVYDGMIYRQKIKARAIVFKLMCINYPLVYRLMYR